jgi:hypothetical protein
MLLQHIGGGSKTIKGQDLVNDMVMKPFLVKE